MLKSIRRIHPYAIQASLFRAQDGPGNINGENVPSYLDEIYQQSTESGSVQAVTETYARLKLLVDNWRWRGVPVSLRTGKRIR